MPVQLNFHSRVPLKATVNDYTDFVTFEIFGENNNCVTHYVRDTDDAVAILKGAMELVRKVQDLSMRQQLAELGVEESRSENRNLDSDGTYTETDSGDWVEIICNPVE